MCIYIHIYIYIWDSQVGIVVKNPLANSGDIRDMSSILGLGRSPGKRHSNPLQYSCLENPTDKGVWWATVHSVEKRNDWSDLACVWAHTHTYIKLNHFAVHLKLTQCWKSTLLQNKFKKNLIYVVVGTTVNWKVQYLSKILNLQISILFCCQKVYFSLKIKVVSTTTC